MSTSDVRAVLWDFGGVILTSHVPPQVPGIEMRELHLERAEVRA